VLLYLFDGLEVIDGLFTDYEFMVGVILIMGFVRFVVLWLLGC